jgi:hypothetical protein
MTADRDRDTNPQEAQQNGQSAISQEYPLRELRQEGDALSDRPARLPVAPAAELTNEEVAVLCDVGRDGSTKSANQPIVRRLIEQGFIDLSAEPLAQLKLTSLAQQCLGRRGVGLNES